MKTLIKILCLSSLCFSNDNWKYTWLSNYDHKWARIELVDGSFIDCQKLSINDSKINYYIKNVNWLGKERAHKELQLDAVHKIWYGSPSFFSTYPIGTTMALLTIIPAFTFSEQSNGKSTAAPLVVGLVGILYGDSFRNSYSKYEHKRIKNWQLVWTNKAQINKTKNFDSIKEYDELEKLYELKEKGIITNEEFEKKKKEILGL